MISNIKAQFESFIPTINTNLTTSLKSKVDVTYAYSFEELLSNTPVANAIGLSWLGTTLANPYTNNYTFTKQHRFIAVVADNKAYEIILELITLLGGGFKINNQAYTININSYAPKPANDDNKLTIYLDFTIYE